MKATRETRLGVKSASVAASLGVKSASVAGGAARHAKTLAALRVTPKPVEPGSGTNTPGGPPGGDPHAVMSAYASSVSDDATLQSSHTTSPGRFAGEKGAAAAAKSTTNDSRCIGS